MARYKLSIVFIQLIISFCFCEIDVEKKVKLVNGFVKFYNSLHNQIYTCEQGYLLSAHQTDIINAFNIEVRLKVSETHSLDVTKYLKCTATVADINIPSGYQDEVVIMKHQCQDDLNTEFTDEFPVTSASEVTEPPIVHKHIQLDNEVQTDTMVTSGEQFIAVPREEPKVHCIGCSSHVNPQAEGVNDLAAIGIRQLNLLKPNTQHSLNSVVDVERQVQVVNGIRYILTLLVDYNTCTTSEIEPCIISNVCKITILEKPWMKLPDGSKYRAILSNNCTEEWQFGNDGVVVPKAPSDNRGDNNSDSNGNSEDFIKPVHNLDVQSSQQTEKTLTYQDIKNIEEQIIPNNQYNEELNSESKFASTTTIPLSEGKGHVVKIELESNSGPNSIKNNDPHKIDFLEEDKKKAIDDLINFFNFADIDSNINMDITAARSKRSFDKELHILNLAEKYHKLKKSINNSKHIYMLAQTVVNYMNEIDLEIKNRILKDVTNAESESENQNNFYYLQFRTVIPCDTNFCNNENMSIKICNAIIDDSENEPQILNVFCHVDNKKQYLGNTEIVPVDDLVLLNLINETIRKIEQESPNDKTLKLSKIIEATTQKVSGTLTKVSVIFEETDCNKSVPIKLRNNCSVVEEAAYKICDVFIHERHWIKDRKITYSCIDRPVDIIFSKLGENFEKSSRDPMVLDILEEALRYLDERSNRNNKQVVIRVNSVSTELVAGFLTSIDFVVGYTSCAFDVKLEESQRCKILENEPLRNCKAKVWDKTWFKDDKQIEVSCNEPEYDKKVIIKRKKRLTQSLKLVGGKTGKDPNDPEYKRLAKKSLQKYLQDSNISNPHKVVSVEKVTVQVVSGLKTEIFFKIAPSGSNTGDNISCVSIIFEQKWKNVEDIDVNCGDDTKIRVKRSIPGGLQEQNADSPEYKILAEKSLNKYLSDSGNIKPHNIVRINKVTTQVVSGKRTIIDFVIAPKDTTDYDVINCKSDIWERTWLNKTEINVNCNQVTRVKREITSVNKKVGSVHLEDASKPEFKELAEYSLDKYRKHKKYLRHHVVAEVKKVTMQVVAGIRYVITFTAAPTSCVDNIYNCDDTSAVLDCHSTVINRPFPKNKDIDISCSTRDNVNKREVTTPNTERNINLNGYPDIELYRMDGKRHKREADEDDIDEDIKFYYADRAVQHLNDKTKSNNLFKLITIHVIQNSVHMDTPMVRMYIEVAETFCLRRLDEKNLADCEEMDGMNHKLCLVRLWPSPDDDMVVQQVSVVCDHNDDFESISGISLSTLIKASLRALEKPRDVYYKLVHQGEPQLIPTLDFNLPLKLNFIVASTNCSKKIENVKKFSCFVDSTKPSKACTSYIWMVPNSRSIDRVSASCTKTENRLRRSISLNPMNATADDLLIQKLVQESLDKLEMSTPQRYKQKVLKINSYSTKVTTGKITTINFDVGFTSCLKYAWVDDLKSCELLEHLPVRHCVSEVWERLWLENGKQIQVTCEDEEVPLEAHVEFESASLAQALADRALKHIEAKYPHPRKQKVVRIFSLEKQVVAGVHYRMKIEVALTNCSALSIDEYCKLDKRGGSENKFCRVNVWLRPWTDHPPNFRVTCDYNDGAMSDIFYQLQAEHLFRDFIATYMPSYIHDHEEMTKRFEIFKSNVRKMHDMNVHERGTAIYGVTRFADLTYEEFTIKHMGLKPNLTDTNQVPMRKAIIPTGDIPDSFDWRDLGAVTPVKDQGSCGSCWAFSVTGNVEGQWQRKSGSLVSLSEQELVDCDTMDSGCNGGLPDNAYRAIEQLGGLESESDYPYEGEDDKCVFNKTLSKVQISGAVNISSNETDMAKWLVSNGPISIGINANAMQFYMGGVSHPWKMLCNPGNLDHGVLIVGYGTKNYPLFHKKLPYWVVKNSWGPSWGEQGYYRVYRGDGTCGVNQMASSALI